MQPPWPVRRRKKMRPAKEEERVDFDMVRTAALTLFGLIIGFRFRDGGDSLRSTQEP
jgi:hypothetical protein